MKFSLHRRHMYICHTESEKYAIKARARGGRGARGDDLSPGF